MKVLTPGLKKGQWTPDEDQLLRDLVNAGHKNWGSLAEKVPGRTSKQCRERWFHALDPNINKTPYTPEEDAIVLKWHAELGNRWATIAKSLNGRTENSVKIRYKALDRLEKRKKRDAENLRTGRGPRKQSRRPPKKAKGGEIG